MKTRQDWLFQLRRCTSRETLEKVIEASQYRLTSDEIVIFNSAADHRLAELIMNRLYDKVPGEVWTYVR